MKGINKKKKKHANTHFQIGAIFPLNFWIEKRNFDMGPLVLSIAVING